MTAFDALNREASLLAVDLLDLLDQPMTIAAILRRVRHAARGYHSLVQGNQLVVDAISETFSLAMTTLINGRHVRIDREPRGAWIVTRRWTIQEGLLRDRFGCRDAFAAAGRLSIPVVQTGRTA